MDSREEKDRSREGDVWDGIPDGEEETDGHQRKRQENREGPAEGGEQRERRRMEMLRKRWTDGQSDRRGKRTQSEQRPDKKLSGQDIQEREAEDTRETSQLQSE
jgi:hypothetical protein